MAKNNKQNLVNCLLDCDNYNSSDTDEVAEYVLIGNGLLDTFIKQDSLKSSSQKALNQYGNYNIKRIQIYRTPVNKMINKFLKVISFGKFNKNSYDDLFHLAFIATVDTPQGDKNIVVEKNATINISTSYDTNEKTEVLDVPLNNKQLNLKTMMENTLNKVGNKRFYLYDAFNRDNAKNGGNCQQFIMDILTSNNLSNPKIKEFVFQPLESLVEDLGSVGKSVIPTVARAITDIGAVFGAGEDGFKLHTVIVKRPVSEEEINKIHNEFIKNKNRNFMRVKVGSIHMRNIPKQSFIKNSFKSKKLNDKITLVFGQLKPEKMKTYNK
jgi:hypothetical protein